MIYGTVYKHGNNNSQVYGISFGWTSLFPMKLKSEAHEKFTSIFKRDGVPPDMIMYNYKEQLNSDFHKNLSEANFHQKRIEPYLPWIR